MRKCIDVGYNVYVYKKIGDNKNKRWEDKENLKISNKLNIKDVDEYNNDNIWFIKVAIPE